MAGITKGRFAEIAAIIESRYEIRAVKTRRKSPREPARTRDRGLRITLEKETEFYMRITLICLIALRQVTVWAACDTGIVICLKNASSSKRRSYTYKDCQDN